MFISNTNRSTKEVNMIISAIGSFIETPAAQSLGPILVSGIRYAEYGASLGLGAGVVTAVGCLGFALYTRDRDAYILPLLGLPVAYESAKYLFITGFVVGVLKALP